MNAMNVAAAGLGRAGLGRAGLGITEYRRGVIGTVQEVLHCCLLTACLFTQGVITIAVVFKRSKRDGERYP